MSTQSKPSNPLYTLIAIGVGVGAVAGVVVGYVTVANQTNVSQPPTPSSSDSTPSDAAQAQSDAPIVAQGEAQSPVPARAQAGNGASPDQAEITSTTASASGLSAFQFSDLTLTDHRGEPIDETIFDGRETVVTFFFTSCQGPCPALTRIIKRVQDETPKSDLRFLSISVDGANDTPDIIRGYGEAYGADFSRWTFATGAPDEIAAMARDALSFTIQKPDGQTVPGPRGASVPNIIHPTRLLLVGSDRRVASVYAYNDPDQVDQLIAAYSG